MKEPVLYSTPIAAVAWLSFYWHKKGIRSPPPPLTFASSWTNPGPRSFPVYHMLQLLSWRHATRLILVSQRLFWEKIPCSRCDLRSAEKRIITSLSLPTLLFLMQTSFPLAFSVASARYSISCLCWKCMLLTHVQFMVHQDPQVLFCKAAFWQESYSLYCGTIILFQLQNFQFVFGGLHVSKIQI